jgi:signal transduction histidine kinase
MADVQSTSSPDKGLKTMHGNYGASAAHDEDTARSAILRMIGRLPGNAVLLSAGDLRIKYVSNDIRSHVAGLFKDEHIIGRSITDLFREGPDDPLIILLRQVSEDGVGKEGKEVAVIGDSGRMYIDWSATPIETGTDEWDVLLQVRDITQRKKLEQELVRANRDLQQFAYVASHDLKEPLRMVTSYLQLLRRRSGDKLDDRSRQYIGFAIDGAERMDAMIDDLLDFSRVETQGKEFAAVDMDEVLSIALRDHRESIAESGATVTHDALPMVLADRSQMILLMDNLISNAIKFRDVAAPQVHISAHGDGWEWVFSVHDNGIGIDQEYQDRLFQMFQRLHTRDEYPGTGMGLAIAKRIVERHGGRIWFESVPGEGTTFLFSIPVKPKARVEAVPPRRPDGPPG